KPDIIVGPYSSAEAESLISSMGKSDIPIILPSATLDQITRIVRPNIFRVALPAGILVESAFDFIHSQNQSWKLERIVVLSEGSVFARSITSAIESTFSNTLDVPLDIVEYESSELPALLESLEKLEHQAVIIISRSVQDCMTITNKLQKKSKIIGCLAGFLTPQYRKYAIENNADVYLLSPWQDDSQLSIVKTFIREFSDKYSSSFSQAFPQYHNVQAYSSLLVAAQALQIQEESKHTLNEILVEHVFKTPLGRISFVNFAGYFQQSITGCVIQQITGGKVKTIYPADQIVETNPEEIVQKPFLRRLLDNQFIALFSILALGLLLGSISIGGVSLGSSGVLFVALIYGHYHYTIPSGVGTLGLIFFIFCVGISAGPSFFSAFAKQGANLAKLSIFIVTFAALITVCMSIIFHIPRDLAAGLFAGALTSTPALAAAMDSLKDLGTHVSVGYGISYPFGIIGVVLFVQLLPKLLRQNLDTLSETLSDQGSRKGNIVLKLVEVFNPSIIGRSIDECTFIAESHCQISRVLINHCLIPVQYDTKFEIGQILRIVGEEKKIQTVIDFIGKKAENIRYDIETDKDIMDIVVTSSDIAEKTLKELGLLKNYGLTITRITRADHTFVPGSDTSIELHDQLRTVGPVEALKQFADICGHRTKALHETDLLSLAVGILFGVMIGLVPISVAGTHSFTIGLSGGLLLTSLLLGHFGRIGKIVGRIPIASRLLLMEMGLVFFLANAGVKAGSSFIQICQEYGLKLFLIGGLITVIPVLTGYLFATYVLKINLLQSLGGICGGMTSTPALGAIRSKTDSDIPLNSYAAAYPVALIYMLIASQMVILALHKF
ncbi:MAG: TrkA C-terminal domain-containing protein, partial [Chlamydiota bacterium]|nr:TrkA C-terminal domain-containing protein [Chlamydiota bacterium]